MPIGRGWTQLLDELEGELRALDPDNCLSHAGLSSSGLLRLSARLSPETAAAGNKLLREYEGRASTTCELCASPGHVIAGPVIVIRCLRCRGDRI